MADPAPAFTPTSRKRNGSVQYLTKAKLPCNSSHIKIQISFSYLPYVPAYSLDPKRKTKTTPTPDLTDYLMTINNRIKVLATGNPIGQTFGNKSVGYNHSKSNYKSTSWLGYNSIAPEPLRFAACYTYTDRELTARSYHLYNHIEKFIDSLG